MIADAASGGRKCSNGDIPVARARLGSSEPAQQRHAAGCKDDRHGLPPAVQLHLGSQLQVAYAALIRTALPQRFLDLMAQLDTALVGRGGQTAASFRQDLLGALPGLRAFALSLVHGRRSRRRSGAEDAAQSLVEPAPLRAGH